MCLEAQPLQQTLSGRDHALVNSVSVEEKDIGGEEEKKNQANLCSQELYILVKDLSAITHDSRKCMAAYNQVSKICDICYIY